MVKIPLAHPEQAAVVSTPRIFSGLAATPHHGQAEADKIELDAARAKGKYVVSFMGMDFILPDDNANTLLAGVVKQRGGTGAPTAAIAGQWNGTAWQVTTP